MGLLFKLLRTVVVPLLFFSFIRSFMQDFLRKAAQQQGGARRDWQRTQWNGQGGAGSGFHAAPKSAYEVFGLPRNASNDEIRARYRELISKYHPDKFAGLNDPEFTRLAAEKFQQVQGAYEEIKRARGM
jgi:DnaJ like chaperone protein